MKNLKKYYKLISAIIIFMGIPILIWTLGDFPRKSILKDGLSLLTMLGLFSMLSQFYLTRHNSHFEKGKEFAMVVKIHTYLGYIFMSVIFLHPFFIVLPRFFEAGVSPGDAFLTLITEFGSLGVVLGIAAYVLMLAIFLTSFFRKKFSLQYRTGRLLHGYLSVVFILAASWHAINLGKHTNMAFTVYIVLLALVGIFYLFRAYYLESKKEVTHE